MRNVGWFALTLAIFLKACSCGDGGEGGSTDAVQGGDGNGQCVPACEAALVCRFGACIEEPTACTSDAMCQGDTYCDEASGECLPFGVGPGGRNDLACVHEPTPGVFFPGAQCEWLGPPAGDMFPDHKNVLSAPMVVRFEDSGEFSRPSIVFVSYNFTDGGEQSCKGTDPAYFGVIRIIDGRSCEQLATLADPQLVASASVAVGDIGGDDAIPEIIGARQNGGLVAFTLRDNQWEALWQTNSNFGDAICNWSGPTIADLDDDGRPEISLMGAVYDADGMTLDESLPDLRGGYNGYIPVIADVDGDSVPELVTGAQLYSWDKTTSKWQIKGGSLGTAGQVAVADLGTYGADPMLDDRATLDGVAEIVIVNTGKIRAVTVAGREVFSADLKSTGSVGRGGPPTIADFDGDGRAEFASAGATAYSVFDPDCQGTPQAETCPALTTDGVAWFQASQDLSSNVTGSSVFDFDGDSRAEVVYGDECFTRVYDGVTGVVQYSRYRTSCTWYENPVIADVDGDFNAEIVSTSNTNCNVTCPALDPIFDGLNCSDSADCPGTTTCKREAAGDVLGRCRCQDDDDCGGDGFVCRDSIAGASPMGKVCRASHAGPGTAFGVRVLSDQLDRWVNTRQVWNQHAYSVTNVTEAGGIPRTSEWVRNWTEPGLNNFRQNSPGEGQDATYSPDLTIRGLSATCEGANADLSIEVCNRGTEPVADGLSVAAYHGQDLACVALTEANLYPGSCQTVHCVWANAAGEVTAKVDDDGTGTGTGANMECKEENNQRTANVDCP